MTGRDDDPLSRVFAPPPNESPADREARIKAEQEAKRISDAIDEEIREQQRAEKKGQRPIKVLLLGEPAAASAVRPRVMLTTACALDRSERVR